MGKIDERVLEYLKTNNKFIAAKRNIRMVYAGKSAQHYGDLLKKYIQEEIKDVKSDTTGFNFLDYINVDIESKGNDASSPNITVSVSFDKEMVVRDSFSPQNYPNLPTEGDVYLPALLNNQWKADPTGRAFGIDRHGNFAKASGKYMDDLQGFVDRAVTRFERETGIKVWVNPIYD